jgi:hypothetical protein
MRVFIIIGIIVVVALMAFGKNPLREFQRQQRELMAKYGNDELSVMTNIYVEQHQSDGQGGGLFGSSQPAQPATEKDMLATIKSSGSDYSALSKQNSEDSSAVKVAKPDDDLPEDIETSIGISRQLSSDTKSVKNSNYYPPIVGQPAASSENQQKPIVLTGKEPKLLSGQVVLFDGTLVYLVDQYGNKTVMPDGTYNLQDDRSITVANGKSILK